MSSFDYVANQPRFAGFWKVPLSENTPPGAWTFESKVDGEDAGQVTFQVIVAARPSDLPKEKPLSTPADIYSLSLATNVDIENLDRQGHSVRHSSGFLGKDGMVFTSFHAVDGASDLRLRFSDGQQVSSPLVAAWNRRHDWVILKTDGKTRPSLKFVEGKNWNVGDHCYWLDVKTDGSRILSDGQIVGLKSPSRWGDRVDISGGYSFSAVGGALLNEKEEVIGILGGALPESYLGNFGVPYTPEAAFSSVSGIAVAINLLPQTLSVTPVSLHDLWDKGDMIPQLVSSKYVLFGMLTQGDKGKGKKAPPGERDLKLQFQRGDFSAGALIHFSSSSGFKSTGALKLYDIDNHLVASSHPEKVNVSRGELAERIWQLPLSNMPAGIYRVDFEMADGVAWRNILD
jgi:Trypsin-like peptidase domain